MKTDQYRELNLPVEISFFGSIEHDLFNRLRFGSLELSRIDRDPELAFHPRRQHVIAVLGIQEAISFAQVDSIDEGVRFADELFVHAIPLELLEHSNGVIGVEAIVDPLGHRIPIPL